MMNNFPDVNETIEFLENSESTWTDVAQEFKTLTDFNRIIAICKNKNDIKIYMDQLDAIAKSLRACIPSTDDRSLKCFYYGAFYMQMKMLPDLFKHMEV